MNAIWFIESDTYSKEEIEPLLQAIMSQGYRYEILYDRDYWKQNWLTLFKDKDCVIFYGGLKLGSLVRREAPWVPGVYCSTENYLCTKYYPLLEQYLLNSPYLIVPYGSLKYNKKFIYDTLGLDGTIFIRPNKGTKIFIGNTIYYENFEKDIDNLGFYPIDNDELCILSSPKNIKKEWRFLIIDHQVITGSQYRPDKYTVTPNNFDPLNGNLNDDLIAANLANEIVSKRKYAPDRCWTLDICKTKAGSFYLLEVGCFSCAGLYKMNMDKVVRAVSESAMDDWNEIYGI